jgi:hypothetical protein
MEADRVGDAARLAGVVGQVGVEVGDLAEAGRDDPYAALDRAGDRQ